MPANVLSAPAITEPNPEGFLARHRKGLVAVAAIGALSSAACAKEPVLITSPTTSTAAETTTSPKAIPTTTQAKHVGQAVLLPGSKHTVVRQYSFSDKPSTFTDYKTMAASDKKIPAYNPDTGIGVEKDASVVADCYVVDPTQLGNSTHGTYYHLLERADGGKDVAGLYAPTNTFWNQPEPGLPDLNRPVDPQVPLCPGS